MRQTPLENSSPTLYVGSCHFALGLVLLAQEPRAYKALHKHGILIFNFNTHLRPQWKTNSHGTGLVGHIIALALHQYTWFRAGTPTFVTGGPNA